MGVAVGRCVGVAVGRYVGVGVLFITRRCSWSEESKEVFVLFISTAFAMAAPADVTAATPGLVRAGLRRSWTTRATLTSRAGTATPGGGTIVGRACELTMSHIAYGRRHAYR